MLTILWERELPHPLFPPPSEIILRSDGALAYLYLEWTRTFPTDTIALTITREGYEAPSETTTDTPSGSTFVSSPDGFDGTLVLAIGTLTGLIEIISAVIWVLRK